MVQLREGAGNVIGSGRQGRARLQGLRSHHNWGEGYTRQELEALRNKRIGLVQLEMLARRTVKSMEKYGPKSPGNYFKAMDLLRLQYNLNFTIMCEQCGGPHGHDELLAPER